MSYNAELQLLREVGWFLLRDRRCFFCEGGFLLPASVEVQTYGHRRHHKVRIYRFINGEWKFDGWTLHHLDEDRTNNSPMNLVDSHTSCHTSHHVTQSVLRRKEAANGR